ncbi:MAG: hypothetical protein Q7J54_05740 [Candidatus Woesearchaeota archaeon]|nr:hypothetical protein [Candidatus Woesearchaeota archaeon]
MVEFNPDGSIKLPEQLARKNEENKEKLRSQRCIKIKREIVSFTAPKKCVLHITLSEAFADNRFIDTIYNYFKERSAVPHKMKKLNEKQFEIEIGTDFKRCSDCNSLINEYREFLDGNIIDEKGSCTFEGKNKSFCYEDYFS